MLKITEENYEKTHPQYSIEVRHEQLTGYGRTDLDSWKTIESILINILNMDLKTKSIVDLGCGCGHFLAYISSKFKEATGIEYDPHGAEIAKQRYPYLNIINGDAFSFDPTEYDILYTFNITRDKQLFIPLLYKLKKGQIFIESHDVSWSDRGNIRTIVSEYECRWMFLQINIGDKTILIKQ